MKKYFLIFLIFILLFRISTYGQSFVTFPDSNATWILGFENDYPFDIQYSAASFVGYGDTIINGLKYGKVISGSYYYSAYRTVGDDTVMVVPHDSTKEFLLYNFSISIGDTVKVWTDGFVHPGINQIICTLISDPFEVSGHMYKQIFFSPQGSWITGVGGAEGPFTTNYAPSVSGLYFLQCVMIDDSTVYSPYNNCFGVGVDPIENERPLYISPNPAQDLLTINVPSSPVDLTIHIYDSEGQKMTLSTSNFKSQTSNSIQLNTEKLPEGFYTLVIINSRTGEKEIGKFVKAE